MESSHTTRPNAGRDQAQPDKRTTARARQRMHDSAQREIDRHMEQLLNLASHELRTPLTTINGNIQLVLRRLSSRESESGHVETMLELLSRAKRQIDRVNNLIEQILHAECIHQGRVDLRIVRCDLVGVIRDTAQQYRFLWPNRTITLTPPDVENGTTALYVPADVERLTQVIANYLSNAIKFSPEQTPVVLLVERRGDQARFAVRDQGPGLPQGEHERIWERFYRAPGIRELSGSSVGFGLGLYICREIARRHGGQSGIESEPGQGSTFWCTLPLLSEDAQAQARD